MLGLFDAPPPSEAVAGEGVGAAVRRTLRGFVTDELPGVPLRITVGGTAVETTSDEEGYFLARLHPDAAQLVSPWTTGTVELAEDGEVLAKGGNVFPGYLDDPDKTAEVIDKDGWLHTGDIGELDDEGYLRIVDRRS